MVISGHSFPLNGTIDIALKFTPLAKVRLHRIRVYLSENTIYQDPEKGHYRGETPRMYLLYEKKAGTPKEEPAPPSDEPRKSALTRSYEYVSRQLAIPPPRGELVHQQPDISHEVSINSSLLGDIESPHAEITSTELELSIPLPGCPLLRGVFREGKEGPLEWFAFHHDITWEKVVVTHWIKVVFRISRQEEQGGKRKFWDLNINAPIKLTSVRIPLARGC
jgi:arrestin-related trafficking adapter 3/6